MAAQNSKQKMLIASFLTACEFGVNTMYGWGISDNGKGEDNT